MKSRLLQVSEAAELIEKVTGLRAGNIQHTAFIKVELAELAFYDSMGRRLAPFPDLFKRIVDKSAPLVPGGQAFKIISAVKVDLPELMNALELHPETQAAILAELENPTPVFSSAKKEAPRGVSKAEILAADWPLPKQDPPLQNAINERPKWLDGAWLDVGRRGRGSHLWNPAKLALCLHDKSRKYWSGPTVSQLTTFITKNFSDYADEWAGYAERLKCGE